MDHEAIRRTLAHRSGDGADASAVAEAAISTWHQAAVRLAPVIGRQGVDVLFRRSLHLTKSTIPWLTMAVDDGDCAALLATLQASLADHEAAAALEASNVLLVNFTELLASLIGKPLTERLLAPIWASSPQSIELNRKTPHAQ
ncbi:MAG TPA: hypothetical protein VJ572_10695 [Azonexus sp.]|nr:hypothetical protein [Azonexus sp.]